MSDRDKLIELIMTIDDGYSRSAAEHLADHLIANGVTVQRWIPVGERLPEVDTNGSGYERCLVIATDGKSVRPMYFERTCVRHKIVRRWKWMLDKIYDGKPITHWMPLPSTEGLE